METAGLRKAGGVLSVLAWLAVWASGAGAAATWSVAAGVPTVRSEIAVAYLDGRVYVAGGIGRLGTSDAFEALDPATGAWTALAPLPAPAHHLGIAALEGRIYIAGGYGDLRFRANRSKAWAYDPKTNEWQRIADMPKPRAAHRLVAVAGRLYAVGGVGPGSTELWAYDPASDRWLGGLAPLPTAREHLAAAAAGGKLYAIAGRWRGRGNLTVVEAYDPASNSWSRVADLPAARGGHTAATLQGRIHVTGGEDLDAGRTFAEHWLYDPATDRWRAAAPMPTARHGLDSAADARHWYVIGGGTGAGYRTLLTLTGRVEVYTER